MVRETARFAASARTTTASWVVTPDARSGLRRRRGVTLGTRVPDVGCGQAASPASSPAHRS